MIPAPQAQNRLPVGWRWVQVGEVCERLDYGFTASADFTVTEPRFLRITDIQNGKVDWETVPGCRISSREQEENSLTSGDIVFARTGGTTGKSFLIKNPPRAVFASYLIRLRLKKEVNAEYIYAFFQSDSYWQQIRLSARGGAQPNVNATLLSALQLPLPPLPEQQRIAAILTEQMAAVERARAAAEAQLEAAEALPAAYLRAVFNSPEARQWHRMNIGDISSLVIDGPHVTPSYVSNGIPFLTVRNIVNRRIDLSEVSYISASNYAEFTRRGKAERGDILYTKDGTLGIPCVVDTDLDFSFFVSVALIKLRRDHADPYFVAFALESPFVLKQVERLGAGAGLKHMVLKSIRALEIPLPPLSEQGHIAAMLNGRMTTLEQTCKVLEEQLDTINRLPAALLRRAFAGEL